MRGLLRRGLVALVVLIAAIGIGLAVWEPLTAHAPSAPPAHSYDTRIVRDNFGVPHIFGATDPDVAYGIAYAHAEDDFSTLQEVVAMTRGRAGALTGQQGAAIDFALHLVRARETVTRDYMKQPADVRALLDAYASGLNRYADTHASEVRLRGLFPVNGQDIAAGFVLRSPFFFGLDAVLGALVGDKPLPVENAGPHPDSPDIAPVPAGAVADPNEGNLNGSNAFVVAPKRSADGFTRLVSNSHQPYRGGVAWYELVVHSRTGWDFAGATFPGAPYPLLGHNKTLGWTNTVNRPDLIDIYKLVLNPAGTQYRFDGKWLPLQTERVWLPVKLWGPFVLPVPKTVYRAVQGPVIINKSGAYAIHYAAPEQLGMVEEYYRLNKARDFAEWQAALSRQAVPATNFLYADAAGNIAYFYNAALLNRKPGFDYAHVLPGDISADLASGTVPWSMIPRNINPASGFLVNANNTPYQAAGTGSELNPADFSPLLGIETDTTNRGTRAIELMGADPSISADDLKRIKFDTAISKYSWAARWFDDINAVDPQGDALIASAKAVMAKWDWNYDGKGPADAMAAILLRVGNRIHYPRKPWPVARDELKIAADYLMKYYGRLDPPLGDVLRLRQGPGPYARDLPLDGGPDVLRAASTWDEAPDGRLVVKHGDSFIMFVSWDKAGKVSSESVQPYGAATTRPESKHYTDQMPLFVRHQLKPVWFDPAALKAHTEREYRP
ncbi:MAG: penicillin acylase family protein [Sphingomonas sp.]|nr:penicillin acylase family protein [Sphingomonas sp.]